MPVLRNFRRILKALRVKWRKRRPLRRLLPRHQVKIIKYFISTIGSRTHIPSSSCHIVASRGAEAQSMIVKSSGCGVDPHSRK